MFFFLLIYIFNFSTLNMYYFYNEKKVVFNF